MLTRAASSLSGRAAMASARAALSASAPATAAVAAAPASTMALTRRIPAASSSALQRRPLSSSSIAAQQVQRSSRLQLIVQRVGQRGYSTIPNQDQVASTFGASFLQFLLILSKGARIAIYTALGIALTGAAVFEGVHQYTERVSMPRSAQASSTARVQAQIRQLLEGKDVSAEEIACLLSFVEEAQDDAWTPSSLASGGTDPRLGFRARHALRAAYMATEWGSGADPSFFINTSSFFGRPTRAGPDTTASLQRAAASLDQGLQYAEKYLRVALFEAERKGIRLPEPAAQRAQLLAQASSAQPDASAPAASVLVPEIDPTVLALEMRLASVRERQGVPRALAAAIVSYERIFDALASCASPLDTSAPGAHIHIPASNTPTAARLVRIATKIGTLNHNLGRREEAEAWLLRAVELASEDRLAKLEAEQQASVAAEAQSESSSWAFWKRKSKAPAPAEVKPSPTATVSEDTPSNPGLTRALISALIGLSAWYAAAPSPGTSAPGSDDKATGTSWLASLEEAVRVQSSALHLVRLEQARSVLAQAPSGQQQLPHVGQAERLHATWVELNDGTLCIHLAETLFGLQAQPQHRRKHVLPSSRGSKKGEDKKHTLLPDSFKKNRYVLSLTWLHQASEQTRDVLEELATPLSDAELQAQARARAKRNARLGEEARAGYAAVERALPTKYRMRPEWRAADGAAAGSGADGAATLDPALGVPAFRLLRDASRMQAEIERMVKALEQKGA
ncbi:hypothetical protein OC842_001432 [Tilletia horrida]|uniref:Uncharacterized protein n=1 Tax=Tilletia horrida TaxID=155126 RepID=A0AAN6JT61_9BASI|nr:hypothetical protein OC842_001432 [Tilletia horrida]KAK0560958.1 hypothetical protein OC844_003473 [Tilletia horrida]